MQVIRLEHVHINDTNGTQQVALVSMCMNGQITTDHEAEAGGL